MKRYLITGLLLVALTFMAAGQSSDPFVSKCVINAGSDAKYLKDFRVQLGKTASLTEPRYTVNISLWKNTKYRFSLCNAENSKGQLILDIRDETNKLILSSHDKKTGKLFKSIDFTCNKSGIYKLLFDFEDGQQGSGVGIVSMVR